LTSIFKVHQQKDKTKKPANAGFFVTLLIFTYQT